MPTLRRLSEADLETMFPWINDKELVELSAPYCRVTWEQHKHWLADITARDDVEIFGITNDDNELIGSCQLRDIDRRNKSAMLQIRIGSADQRGKGYGRRAIRELLAYAYNELGLHRVALRVFATNKRAFRLYEKLGFQIEGLERDVAFVGNKYMDAITMARLADD